ncbi:MAG: UUP1 family membrane protein [Alphaproteobacteria bacterium]|nr:UUP1 family membrane protein [Alphaproteobacteria bacterium]
MLQKLKSVRIMLSIGLFLSVIFAAYSIYYKMHYWGFNWTPKQKTAVWTVESHISFDAVGEPIKVSVSRPTPSKEFKILDEDIVASKYDVEMTSGKAVLSSPARRGKQNIYYRILLYDNVDGKGKTPAEKADKIIAPLWEQQTINAAKEILETAESLDGDKVQQIIRLLNQTPPDQTVQAFMPERINSKETAQMMIDLLALKGISARMIRGIKLQEEKKTFTPDVMLEAYMDKMWKIYDIKTGKKGLPEDFVIFQRGITPLFDVEGGQNSTIKYSVMKSLSSSLKMAGHRAKLAHQEQNFGYSIYNLPLNQQNALKWLMIFPLAILVVVLMRNVIGISTMGTFTPMLIAMSLVETGFWAGLFCFALIIGIGILIRTALSRLNLLLVPRISAVVVFVILIMQALAVIGYNWNWQIASSALFFPIIITAWIIERASITWEEEGASNALKQIIYSVLVAVITYFVIVNDYIRHIMFAFNELNLVILFVVMLLGTYTGYRLTELIRFAPLAGKEK